MAEVTLPDSQYFRDENLATLLEWYFDEKSNHDDQWVNIFALKPDYQRLMTKKLGHYPFVDVIKRIGTSPERVRQASNETISELISKNRGLEASLMKVLGRTKDLPPQIFSNALMTLHGIDFHKSRSEFVLEFMGSGLSIVSAREEDKQALVDKVELENRKWLKGILESAAKKAGLNPARLNARRTIGFTATQPLPNESEILLDAFDLTQDPRVPSHFRENLHEHLYFLEIFHLHPDEAFAEAVEGVKQFTNALHDSTEK